MSFLEKIGFAKKKSVVENTKTDKVEKNETLTNDAEKNDDEQSEASGELSPELIQELDNIQNQAEDLNKIISLNPDAVAEKVKNSKELQDKIYNILDVAAVIGLTYVAAGPVAMLIDHFTGSKLADSLTGVDIDGILDKVHEDAFIVKDVLILISSFLVKLPGMLRQAAVASRNKAEAIKQRKEQRVEMKKNQEISARSVQDAEVEKLRSDVDETTAAELEKVRKDLAA